MASEKSRTQGEERRERITQELPTEEFETSQKRKIVRLSINTLPYLYNSIYIVLGDEGAFLIDLGYMTDFNKFLNKFSQEITQKYGVKIEDVKALFITHAHIDHFGGINLIRNVNPNIEVYVHEVDSKAVERFEEVFIYARHYLKIFLARAGLDEEGIKTYVSMYTASKEFLRSAKITRALHDGDKLYGFEVVHTPGHSPGHMCLILDDVIFTGDHILPYITPHQFPESIMKYTGVGHYIESLDKVREIVLKRKISLGLPAHYSVIEDVVKRIDEIKEHHRNRMRAILDMCKEPLTIVEITERMFPDKKGYQFILALDEVGAHVEYLWDRGFLGINNIDDFLKDDDVPARWVSVRNYYPKI